MTGYRAGAVDKPGFCAQGTLKIVMENTTFTVTAGQCFIIPPGIVDMFVGGDEDCVIHDISGHLVLYVTNSSRPVAGGLWANGRGPPPVKRNPMLQGDLSSAKQRTVWFGPDQVDRQVRGRCRHGGDGGGHMTDAGV